LTSSYRGLLQSLERGGLPRAPAKHYHLVDRHFDRTCGNILDFEVTIRPDGACGTLVVRGREDHCSIVGRIAVDEHYSLNIAGTIAATGGRGKQEAGQQATKSLKHFRSILKFKN